MSQILQQNQRMVSAQADIAVILPAWNEALTVEQTMVGFHEALPMARIYVVDNNSTDDTAALARATLEKYGITGAVLFERRKGKGNAIRRAFLEVDADVYLMADADCTYPPAQAWELLAPVLAGEADMVVGDRRSQGDYSRGNTRPLHSFGNTLVEKLVNMVSGAEYADIMSGYRAMSRAFVRSYPLLVEGFQLETDLMLFAAQGRFRCLEVPVRYIDRPEGSYSKLNTLRDGWGVLMTILRIVRYHRPLTFFGLVSAALALLGLVMGLPVILEYMEHQYIYRVPTAVLAASLEILAATMLSAGLILDALGFQRQVEMEQTIRNHSQPKHKGRLPKAKFIPLPNRFRGLPLPHPRH